MSTTTAPTATATPTENKAVTEAPRKYSFLAKGASWDAIEVVQTKGKGKGNSHNYLDPGADVEGFFNRLKNAVGKDNFFRTLMKEVIQPLCRDAAHELDDETKDAEWTPEQWFEKICYLFTPAALSSTTGVKQLKDDLIVITGEYQPLIARYMKDDERRRMTTEELAKLATLQAKLGELYEKIEKGSRKGKKAPVAKAAPATATTAPK